MVAIPSSSTKPQAWWNDPLDKQRYRGMTVWELVNWDGLTKKEAKHVINTRVFGPGYKIKDGRPIERGHGSANHPTQQHVDALRARHMAAPALGETEEDKKRRLIARDKDIAAAQATLDEYNKRRAAEIEDDDEDDD